MHWIIVIVLSLNFYGLFTWDTENCIIQDRIAKNKMARIGKWVHRMEYFE